jgi:hypothetical protein
LFVRIETRCFWPVEAKDRFDCNTERVRQFEGKQHGWHHAAGLDRIHRLASHACQCSQIGLGVYYNVIELNINGKPRGKGFS